MYGFFFINMYYCLRKRGTVCFNFMLVPRRQYGSKARKLHCDPVDLYQYYQSIWKHHKLPGENDYSQLRSTIRNRFMKGN